MSILIAEYTYNRSPTFHGQPISTRRQFFIFDAIIVNGQYTSMMSYSERMLFINNHVVKPLFRASIDESCTLPLRLKRIWPCTRQTLQWLNIHRLKITKNTITSLPSFTINDRSYGNDVDVDVDGYIFTPEDDSYFCFKHPILKVKFIHTYDIQVELQKNGRVLDLYAMTARESFHSKSIPCFYMKLNYKTVKTLINGFYHHHQ